MALTLCVGFVWDECHRDARKHHASLEEGEKPLSGGAEGSREIAFHSSSP